MIKKLSTDNLIEIVERYDTSNKIYEKDTDISEYSKQSGKYTVEYIKEEINEGGICVQRNRTQYRKDNSTKEINETFSDKGKLQNRVTQEEILAQRIVRTRVEEFDKDGKKTKDERTVEPIK